MEEDFVGVDVADAGEGLLVHEEAFHAAGVFVEDVVESVGREVERVWAESFAFDEAFEGVVDGDAAEFALVEEGHAAAVVEFDLEVGDAGRRFVGGEAFDLAGHAEVEDEAAVVGGVGAEVLAAASGVGEGVAGEVGGESLAGGSLFEDLFVADVDVGDGFVERGAGDAAFVDLDVGEFGHVWCPLDAEAESR